MCKMLSTTLNVQDFHIYLYEMFERPVILALLTTVNINIIVTGCDTSCICGKVPLFLYEPAVAIFRVQASSALKLEVAGSAKKLVPC